MNLESFTVYCEAEFPSLGDVNGIIQGLIQIYTTLLTTYHLQNLYQTKTAVRDS